MGHDNDAVYLGEFQNGERAWLSTSDRRRHLFAIGRSGAGKSNLLKNLMLDDLFSARPFSLIDPAGDLAIQVASAVPAERTNRVLFVDLSSQTHHVGLNPLAHVPLNARPRVAAQILAIFVHAFQLNVEVNARLLNVLNAGLRLLLDAPGGGTLLGLQRLLYDTRYRAALVTHCSDPVVRQFWSDEVERYTDRFETEAFAPLQSRLNLLLSDPAIRHVVGQATSTLSVSRLIDEEMTLLLRVPRGKLGEVPCALLSGLFAMQFMQAAEARADQPEDDRRDHSLFLDEFQLAASASMLADTLAGARKYRLHLVLATQSLSALPERLRHAIPTNCGSLVVFAVSAEDAQALAPELTSFDPLLEHSGLQTANRGVFDPACLTNMQPFSAWTRLMRHGERSERRLLYPALLDAQSRHRFEKVRNNTLATYARPRVQIEQKIARFLRGRTGA